MDENKLVVFYMNEINSRDLEAQLNRLDEQITYDNKLSSENAIALQQLLRYKKYVIVGDFEKDFSMMD